MRNLNINEMRTIGGGATEPSSLAKCFVGFELGAIAGLAAYCITNSPVFSIYFVFIPVSAIYHGLHDTSVGTVLEEYGYK